MLLGKLVYPALPRIDRIDRIDEWVNGWMGEWVDDQTAATGRWIWL